jgi:prepilin-type N-terminal cleavage/methylation domain-containing protein
MKTSVHQPSVGFTLIELLACQPKPWRRQVRGAFTLIELLVVIAIIAVLAAIMFPAIQGAIVKGQMMDTMANGRSIGQTLLAAEMSHSNPWPTSSGQGSYANSTDYWRWMVSNQVVDVTFAFFSAHGLPSYRGLDPAEFKPEQNAWCIAADLSNNSRSMTPVLFTRNLEIATLDAPLATALTENPPYGLRGVIVVRKDNSASILENEDLAPAFNPAVATNVVLRP